MVSPNPPFLEFHMYSKEWDSRVVVRVVEHLVSGGARLTGPAQVHRGAGIRDVPFASIREIPPSDVDIRDLDDLHRLESDANIRIVAVGVSDATRVVGRDVVETVTLESISTHAREVDSHPIAVWTSGDWYDDRRHQGRTRRLGATAHAFFQRLVELEPMYAAVTISEPMESPADLMLDPRSGAFRNFFLSRYLLKRAEFSQLVDDYVREGAFVEESEQGVYLSCSRVFNPAGADVTLATALGLSVRCAKLIGRLGR